MMMIVFLKSTVLPKADPSTARLRKTAAEYCKYPDAPFSISSSRIHRIRRALHAFRQLTAFFITHIPRRRADQLRHRMLLHEPDMSKRIERFLAAEQKFRQRASDFRLAHARSVLRNRNDPDGRLGDFNPARERPDSTSQSADRFLLADHPAMQLFFNAESAWRLLLRESRSSGTPVQRRMVRDIVLRHHTGRGVV